MASGLRQRVFLEEADHPPSSYYAAAATPAKVSRDPGEWVKAPSFVPRHLQEGGDEWTTPSPLALPLPFPVDHHLPQPVFHSFHGVGRPPFLPPLVGSPLGRAALPPPSLPFLPNGYSANITNINPGLGPPIPAIVLKKKRRKRHRNHTNSVIIAAERESLPEEEKAAVDEESTSTGTHSGEAEERHSLPSNMKSDPLRFGSCPDLSEAQLRLWDNFLYDRVVEGRPSPPPPAPKASHDAMERSAYEMVPRALLNVAEQAVNGISSHSIRQLDRELNGNDVMTASTVMREVDRAYSQHSDGSTVRTLASELDHLSFRPQITKYGYPQFGQRGRAQIMTLHANAVRSSIIDSSLLDEDGNNDGYVQDSLEGFHLQMNAFDDCQDVLMSESELPEPSRFQQIQWALQRNAELRPPDRVCCSLM